MFPGRQLLLCEQWLPFAQPNLSKVNFVAFSTSSWSFCVSLVRLSSSSLQKWFKKVILCRGEHRLYWYCCSHNSRYLNWSNVRLFKLSWGDVTRQSERKQMTCIWNVEIYNIYGIKFSKKYNLPDCQTVACDGFALFVRDLSCLIWTSPLREGHPDDILVKLSETLKELVFYL